MGLGLLYATPAAAGHLSFISESRQLETPSVVTGPSTPFAVFSESRSESSFHVSQTSFFPTDRFVGNGSATAPPFIPNIIPDPSASSLAGFAFSIAETTSVRVEATLFSSGTSFSSLALSRTSPSSASLIGECAGYLCNLTAFFPETKTVDNVLTLTPGTYSFGVSSYTDARDFFAGDESTWSVRFTSPPAVPVAGWTRVGMITSLLLAGLAQIRRRAHIGA